MKLPSAEEFIWAVWLSGVSPVADEPPQTFMNRCAAAFARYDEWTKRPPRIVWEPPQWTMN